MSLKLPFHSSVANFSIFLFLCTVRLFLKTPVSSHAGNNRPFRKGLKFSFELSLLELGAEAVVEVPGKEEEERGGRSVLLYRS